MKPPRSFNRMLRAFIALSLAASTAPSAAGAEMLKIGGTGGDLGTMRLLGSAFERIHGDVTVKVLPSLGSGGGIRAVQAGAIDIAVSSRPLNDKERKAGVRQLLTPKRRS